MRLKRSLLYDMRRTLTVAALVGLVLSGCGAPVDSSGGVAPFSSDVERADPDRSAPLNQLAEGFNDAGFDFWRTQPPEGNLVFSPVSIAHTLLMVRAAADDPTGSAIDSLFGLPEDQMAHEAWNSIDQRMAVDAEASENMRLAIADRIWPAIEVAPSQEWIDLLASHHGASVQALDFPGDPESSRNVINSWISEQTDGLIPELLPEGMINEQTRVMLTDTIYFRASWAVPFHEEFNVVDEFTRLDGTTIETEYLHKLQVEDRAAVGEGFVAAEIPYAGGAFTMVVIVPEAGQFPDLRDRLTQDFINEIDELLTPKVYELFLPKWETTSKFDLGGWLNDTGVSPGSYPGIDPEAFLGGAVHAADITVDEEGTVAAAATAIEIEGAAPPEPEITIRVDRPFYYLIRHEPTGLTLFAGQVTQPAES